MEELAELAVHITGEAWRLHGFLKVSRGSSKVALADVEDAVKGPGVGDLQVEGVRCGMVTENKDNIYHDIPSGVVEPIDNCVEHGQSRLLFVCPFCQLNVIH